MDLSMRMAALGVAFCALSLASCAPKTDMGTPCSMRLTDGGIWLDVSQTNDFVYVGTPECENLVCIRPAASDYPAGQGICSNLCSPQNAGDPNSPSNDCDSKDTHLVCRPSALDQDFINEILKLDGGAALLEKYLGSVSGNYCTTQIPTE